MLLSARSCTPQPICISFAHVVVLRYRLRFGGFDGDVGVISGHSSDRGGEAKGGGDCTPATIRSSIHSHLIKYYFQEQKFVHDGGHRH